MKKQLVVTLLIFGIAYSSKAMDNDPAAQAPEPSGFSYLDFFQGLGEFGSKMAADMSQITTEISETFNGKQAEQDDAEQEESSTEQAKELVRQELKNKRLSQAINDATQQEGSRAFTSLLIGMKALDIRASNNSETVIRNYLDVLQQKHRADTEAFLQEQMEKGRELHALRKQFADADGYISDDEGYTSLEKFAHKLLGN